MSSNQVPIERYQNAQLKFEQTSISMVDVNCKVPTVQLERAHLSSLGIDGLQPGQTIKGVYGIDLSPKEDGQLVRVTCGKDLKPSLPNTHKSSLFTEKAAFLRNNGELIVALHVDGIYLARRKENLAKATPSFDCAKVSNATEKAICASSNLAALDQQMASVYNNALDSAKSWGDNGACMKGFKEAHAKWLKKRNSCGAEEKCLERSFKDQIGTESEGLEKWLPKSCSVG